MITESGSRLLKGGHNQIYIMLDVQLVRICTHIIIVCKAHIHMKHAKMGVRSMPSGNFLKNTLSEIEPVVVLVIYHC